MKKMTRNTPKNTQTVNKSLIFRLTLLTTAIQAHLSAEPTTPHPPQKKTSWRPSPLPTYINHLHSHHKKQTPALNHYLDEHHNMNGLQDPEDKCVDRKNSKNCLECIVGWGPYQETFTSSYCRSCEDLREQDKPIKRCSKCMWQGDYKDGTRIYEVVFKCMNCTKGYHVNDPNKIRAPFHFGERCIKCAFNCVDCLDVEYCTACRFDREPYSPDVRFTINDRKEKRYCRLQFPFKIAYGGVFFLGGLLVWILASIYLCGNVGLIARPFYVENDPSKTFLPIGRLMKVQNVAKNRKITIEEKGDYMELRGQEDVGEEIAEANGVEVEDDRRAKDPYNRNSVNKFGYIAKNSGFDPDAVRMNLEADDKPKRRTEGSRGSSYSDETIERSKASLSDYREGGDDYDLDEEEEKINGNYGYGDDY